MRDYGKVHTSYWSSSTIRAMSEDGRTLAMYLLTCPHGTIAGVFRLPDGYACEDLQWGSERVREGFAELFRNGFANRCETTKWVWIAKHFQWNPPENPNQKKAAAKIAAQVPDECRWKLDFMRDCGDFVGLEKPPERNPSETLPKPFLNQEQYQYQYQEQEQEQEESKPVAPGHASPPEKTAAPPEPKPSPPASPAAPPVGSLALVPVQADTPPDHPPKPKAQDSPLQVACRATWVAYSTAYRERYGTDPVVNAKVRSQVKALVQRIGADEAPQVAGWFVGHGDARYVRNMHAIGELLAQAENLRTQWATGNVMTATRARQFEFTAANLASHNGALEILRSKGLA